MTMHPEERQFKNFHFASQLLKKSSDDSLPEHGALRKIPVVLLKRIDIQFKYEAWTSLMSFTPKMALFHFIQMAN